MPQYTHEFADLPILPELKAERVSSMIRKRLGLAIWCRECGRKVVMTPLGMSRRFGDRLKCKITCVAPALTCSACGGRQLQLSSYISEGFTPGLEIIDKHSITPDRPRTRP